MIESFIQWIAVNPRETAILIAFLFLMVVLK